MKCRLVAAALAVIGFVYAADLTPPQAGKPEILPLADVKPGMRATAWTVFAGSTPEPVPTEIIGITTIESMLEIQDFDNSRPSDARTPDKVPTRQQAAAEMPADLLAHFAP